MRGFNEYLEINNYEDAYEGLLFFERVENEKDIEMKNIGYTFITNFTPEREEKYRKAAEINNIDIKICEAYDGFGRQINYSGYQALYADSTIQSLSSFWRTVEEQTR